MTEHHNQVNQEKQQPLAKEDGTRSQCALPPVEERTLAPTVDPNRARLIRLFGKKWVNGTELHYYFFDRDQHGGDVNVVRNAFDVWKELGIGLKFSEVATPSEAEIRIGFIQNDGAWSYVGRDILNAGQGQRTMNFGWSLTNPREDIDTAVHEIGHTLGFPHEHQNPISGIVWDEAAVYAALAQPPHGWDEDTTYYNIIRKIPADRVQGSVWDKNSIMHYPFEPGLILQPVEFLTNGLQPTPGLSARDRTWVKTFYPTMEEEVDERLLPFESARLTITEGEQKNFRIEPEATRWYDIRTFGVSDTVIVLFEEVDGELRYLAGDDDSGEDYNASLEIKLFKNHKYVLRVRLYYVDTSGELAVMVW